MPNNPNQTTQVKPDAKARDSRPITTEEKARNAKAHPDKGSKSGSDKSSCGC